MFGKSLEYPMFRKTYLLLLMFFVLLTGCQQVADEPVEPLDKPSSPTIPPPTDTEIPPTDTPSSTQTPTPKPTINLLGHDLGYEEVYMTSSDGMDLFGALYLPSEPIEAQSLAVVLGHEMGASHFSWRSFGKLLAENGFTALAISFRGYHGSGGVRDVSTVKLDINAAVDYLSDQGFEQIACIGASMGGAACLAAAVDGQLAGIVNISGPMNIPGTRLVTPNDLQNLTIPKIFVIAEDDVLASSITGFVDDFIEMGRIAVEPKGLLVYPGLAHGTGLFFEDYGTELQERIIDFLISLDSLEN